MKESKEEKLSGHLSEIDGKIIERAYEIDDAEKLRQYVLSKGAVQKRKSFLRAAAIGALAAVLCLTVGFGGVMGYRYLNQEEPVSSIEDETNNYLWQDTTDGIVTSGQDPETLSPETSDLTPETSGEAAGTVDEAEIRKTITSFDMLWFYSGVYALGDAYQGTLRNQSVTPQAIQTLSSYSANAYRIQIPIASSSGRADYFDKSGSSAIVYNNGSYTVNLNPDAAFVITKVVYFEIELKNDNCALASKVGTGRIEVLISYNDFDDIITFKNGDRYYSCCKNSASVRNNYSTITFSTHKYFEGFTFVKNFDQENYQFTVTFDKYGNAKLFTTTRYDKKVNHTYGDQLLDVTGATLTFEGAFTSTVKDLCSYIISKKSREF